MPGRTNRCPGPCQALIEGREAPAPAWGVQCRQLHCWRLCVRPAAQVTDGRRRLGRTAWLDARIGAQDLARHWLKVGRRLRRPGNCRSGGGPRDLCRRHCIDRRPFSAQPQHLVRSTAFGFGEAVTVGPLKLSPPSRDGCTKVAPPDRVFSCTFAVTTDHGAITHE
jgi:hypothetical protein